MPYLFARMPRPICDPETTSSLNGSQTVRTMESCRRTGEMTLAAFISRRAKKAFQRTGKIIFYKSYILTNLYLNLTNRHMQKHLLSWSSTRIFFLQERSGQNHVRSKLTFVQAAHADARSFIESVSVEVVIRPLLVGSEEAE